MAYRIARAGALADDIDARRMLQDLMREFSQQGAHLPGRTQEAFMRRLEDWDVDVMTEVDVRVQQLHSGHVDEEPAPQEDDDDEFMARLEGDWDVGGSAADDDHDQAELPEPEEDAEENEGEEDAQYQTPQNSRRRRAPSPAPEPPRLRARVGPPPAPGQHPVMLGQQAGPSTPAFRAALHGPDA